MTFYGDFLEPFFKIKRDNEDDLEQSGQKVRESRQSGGSERRFPGGKRKQERWKQRGQEKIIGKL